MSDISHTDEPLGIVTLLTDTFSLFLSRFPLFTGIALIPILVMNVLPNFLFPEIYDLIRSEQITSIWQIYTPAFIIFTLLSLLVSTVVGGVIILAAYDAALGNRIVLGTYVSRALGATVPIFVLGILYYIIVVLGFILLIIPGLYLAARLFAFTPAILIEGVGFRGLSRSSELTKGYRWPIAGMLIVLIALGFGLGYMQDLLFKGDGTGGIDYLSILLQSIVAVISTALSGVLSAIVYARLREIKEGVGMSDLATVFR